MECNRKQRKYHDTKDRAAEPGGDSESCEGGTGVVVHVREADREYFSEKGAGCNEGGK